MKLVGSKKYSELIELSRSSMATFYKDNSLVWDDQERRDIYENCELFEIIDSAGLGYVLVREVDDRFVIADFQVRKEYQGQGVGTSVLFMLKLMARERGYGYIWLKSFKTSPANSLYFRCGFKIMEEQGFLYVQRAIT